MYMKDKDIADALDSLARLLEIESVYSFSKRQKGQSERLHAMAMDVKELAANVLDGG